MPWGHGLARGGCRRHHAAVRRTAVAIRRTGWDFGRRLPAPARQEDVASGAIVGEWSTVDCGPPAVAGLRWPGLVAAAPPERSPLSPVRRSLAAGCSSNPVLDGPPPFGWASESCWSRAWL